MFRLVRRDRPSGLLQVVSPLLALSITVLVGSALFAALDKPPLAALQLFFLEPLNGVSRLGELSVKATPIMLIALGLLLCFRANVWNIGAEGQYIAGATLAGGVALCASERSSPLFLLLVLVAGVLGGALWAGLCALLRDRCNANEILVSLMLVYVAELLLGYLVYGPWKDPAGFNFPQTVTFAEPTRLPSLFSGTRAHWGFPLALLLAAIVSVLLFRTQAGFKLRVAGLAPRAASYAGISARRVLWSVLLGSGALAGLAGALEVAGPLGQLTPYVPVGYGFTAIIVVFVGRLQPLGVLLSALLLSVLSVGGELAQSRLGLPKSVASVFQGVLLFSLLACDTFVERKLELQRPAWLQRERV